MFDKLNLRSEMEQSYLIQRLQKSSYHEINGQKVDNPFSFGGGMVNGGLSKKAMEYLREIFSFDYMGSAEFEFGAVPAAIEFLARQNIEKNLVSGVVGKNKPVYYICPKPYEEEVKKRIKVLRDKNYPWRTKEWVGLKEYFEGDDNYSKRNQGWLELDNGYAFFVNKDMFEGFQKFLGAFVADGK